MRYSVMLKGGQDKLTFVGGWDKDREYQECAKGLSVFLNDKYLLNFVLLPDEVKFLQSDSSVKSIKDIGHIFFSDDYSLTIMKHYSDTRNEGYFLENIEASSEDAVNKNSYIFSVVHLYCGVQGAINRAIAMAMNNLETESNLYHAYPENSEEIIL